MLLQAAEVNLESRKISKMELFCENIPKLKALTVFLKTFVLDFQQAHEYVSKLASKCKFRMFHFKSI